MLSQQCIGVNAAGALIGSLANAWLADKFSRKHTIQYGAILLVVGGALCAGSVNVAMFIVARIVAGLGIGILTVSGCGSYQEAVKLTVARA